MGIVEGALLALAAAGTATSVYAQQQQAKQANQMADQQDLIAKQDAQFAASEAQVQAKMIRKATDRQRAEARAALAGSGVTVGVGTAEQIDQEIAADGEQDALMAIYDGGNRARQIQVQGNLESTRSRNAASAARINSVGTALQGGATIARGWNTSGKK